jgi:hypothetical protein
MTTLWSVFYDFFIALLSGSEFDSLAADLLALALSLIVIYLIIILPLQLLIRYIVRLVSSLSGTPAFYSTKKKYNKPPKL